MAHDELTPSKFGAPGSLSIDTRNVGRAVPAFKSFVINDVDLKHYFAGVVETKAPSGIVTGAAPRQYAGVNQSMQRLDNGVQTIDTTFTDVVQGMVLADTYGYTGTGTSVTSTTLTDSAANWPVNHFAGQTVHMGGQTSTVASNTATVLTVTAWTTTPTAGFYIIDSDGAANLVVGFGSSNTPRIAYRDLSTDTSPWSTQTAATYAQFWLITRVGGAGYAAMTDAGVTSLGEYRISQCPLGNDIRLVSSWGNGLEVGGPEWGITGLTSIGDAPVVGKPDGLWYYDVQTRRYENVLKHLEIVPHALNGKVTEAVTGGVVYTTHDGRAYFFDGSSVQEISPNKFWPILNRDIGNSRITAVADNGDTLAMVTETAYQTTQNANLVVNTVTAGEVATSITTNVVDGSMATGGDVSNLAATSHIDVWADVPFEGVVMHVTRKSNSTTTAVFGAVKYSSATDTFTTDPNGFIDGTRLSVNGSLSYVAFPPSASAGLVMGKSINFGSLQQAVTYNYASGTDITTAKYGMRISMSGAAFDSTTEIDELEIIPYRAGMPNSGIYGTTTNFTPRDRAGLITHVYLCKRTHTTGFTPHDSYALNTYPGVWKMAWHTGRLGIGAGGQNLGQSLILWGRYRTMAVSESVTRDPVRTRYPLLQNVGTVSPGPLVQIAYEWSGKSGEEHLYKRLTKIEIDTRFVQPADQIEVFLQSDDRDIISLGTYTGGPLFIVPGNASAFRYMNMWVGFKQNVSTVANAPHFLEPYTVEYDVLAEPTARDVATATPETT